MPKKQIEWPQVALRFEKEITGMTSGLKSKERIIERSNDPHLLQV